MVLHFGYMEHPRVGEARSAPSSTVSIFRWNLEDLTYYVGDETLTAGKSGKMGKVAEAIFAYLQRNAIEVESTFCLSPNRVVELGTQIDV